MSADIEAEKESWRKVIAKQAAEIVRLRALCRAAHDQLVEHYDHSDDQPDAPFPGAGMLISELGSALGGNHERQPATTVADPRRGTSS